MTIEQYYFVQLYNKTKTIYNTIFKISYFLIQLNLKSARFSLQNLGHHQAPLKLE